MMEYSNRIHLHEFSFAQLNCGSHRMKAEGSIAVASVCSWLCYALYKAFWFVVIHWFRNIIKK